MKFKIEIDCGNAAFGDDENGADAGPEVARILAGLAHVIQTRGYLQDILLRDINGNKVGTAGFTEE